jgi:hypothetical protein
MRSDSAWTMRLGGIRERDERVDGHLECNNRPRERLGLMATLVEVA